jgi:hypothetical protein
MLAEAVEEFEVWRRGEGVVGVVVAREAGCGTGMVLCLRGCDGLVSC